MSDYFSKKNTQEFGPAPIQETRYLVIEDPTVTGDKRQTRVAFVWAKTGFQAREEARRIIPEFKDTAFLCFPNPVEFKG